MTSGRRSTPKFVHAVDGGAATAPPSSMAMAYDPTFASLRDLRAEEPMRHDAAARLLPLTERPHFCSDARQTPRRGARAGPRAPRGALIGGDSAGGPSRVGPRRRRGRPVGAVPRAPWALESASVDADPTRCRPKSGRGLSRLRGVTWCARPPSTRPSGSFTAVSAGIPACLPLVLRLTQMGDRLGR